MHQGLLALRHWAVEARARRRSPRPPVAMASLTSNARCVQAPTDVEGQLAELQRKYRILEVRALLPRRLRPRLVLR